MPNRPLQLLDLIVGKAGHGSCTFHEQSAGGAAMLYVALMAMQPVHQHRTAVRVWTEAKM